jgi:hypothetical protein
MRAALVIVMTITVIFAQNKLSKDVQGWTIFVPSSDTRIAYVSQSSGDDATGQPYAANASDISSDPFNPASSIKPYKSIAAALKAVRDTFPDWVLLKSGDTWYESGDVKNGRSDTEPFLFSAYGGAVRPLLKTGVKAGFDVCCKNTRNFAVVGISFYAHTRDPVSKDFSSDSGSTGFNIYTGEGYSAHGILIEDCVFRFYTNNVVQGPGTLNDIVIRRNVIADDYCANAHSQGLYTNNVSLLLEENVFDHNGWFKQSINADNAQAEGQATMFNHNTYFSAPHDVIFRNNLFLRASSIGNKWTANDGAASARNITIDNNLYVEGEIGISMGGNEAGPYRFKNISITNNVMLDIGRARPTNRTLGWGLDIQEWDSGSVYGNLFLHNALDTVNNVYAINVNGAAGSRGITIANNVIFGMKTNGSLVTFIDTLASVVFRDNAVQSQNIAARLVTTGGFSGLSFSSNSYFSARPAAEWFRAGGTNADLAGWVTRSGETGAQGNAISYPDPDRTVESYHASLGKPATFSSFIDEARKQSKANWRPEYTAAAINDWIRAGFGLKMSVSPGAKKTVKLRRFNDRDQTHVAIYSINGRRLGSLNSIGQARRELPGGLYLIGVDRKAMVRLVIGGSRGGN